MFKKFKIKRYNIIRKILGGGLPIGLIGISDKIYKNIKDKKEKVFFGGTFSGNSMSSFIGYNTIKYLKKNQFLLKELIKKSEYFQKTLNNFFLLNKIDAKVYRFQSILRIIFSNKKIYSRLQRDFLKNKKNEKILKLKKYLFDKGIYYPSNGIIFLSTAMTIKVSIL